MTMESQPAQRIDPRLLDRLVDGELDVAGRRELLNALDEHPGGWRRCALAFLEAQALRSDLRGAVSGSFPVTGPAASVVAGPRSGNVRLAQAGMIAAALIVAFGAGWFVRPGDGRRPIGSGTAASNAARDQP